jgi:hypothetical protein
MSNHINEILFALADAKIDFVIGGGVAAVLHGVERVTLDVDLALNMEPENIGKFIRVMQELRLQPRVPVPARDLMSPEAVERMMSEKDAVVLSFVDFDRPLRHVDVFLRRDLSFEELSNGADVILVEGREIKIINVTKLLEIKRAILPLRDKDLTDIKQLAKLQETGEEPQN